MLGASKQEQSNGKAFPESNSEAIDYRCIAVVGACSVQYGIGRDAILGMIAYASINLGT
jgi:hypothetical protein